MVFFANGIATAGTKNLRELPSALPNALFQAQIIWLASVNTELRFCSVN
jgi:hypothetical protein